MTRKRKKATRKRKKSDKKEKEKRQERERKTTMKNEEEETQVNLSLQTTGRIRVRNTVLKLQTSVAEPTSSDLYLAGATAIFTLKSAGAEVISAPRSALTRQNEESLHDVVFCGAHKCAAKHESFAGQI